MGLGLAGAAAIAFGHIGWGLALICANRLFDGLGRGGGAGSGGRAILGGYFDIVADFAFYVAVPLGFGILASANTLPAPGAGGEFCADGG